MDTVNLHGLKGLLEETKAQKFGNCTYQHETRNSTQFVSFQLRDGHGKGQVISAEHHDYVLSIPSASLSITIQNGAGTREIDSSISDAEFLLHQKFKWMPDDAKYVISLMKTLYNQSIIAKGLNQTEGRLAVLLLKSIMKGDCGD